MSVEIPRNIQIEIDEFLAPGKTGQICLNVYQGKIVSAELKRHVKAEPPDVHQQKFLDFHQSTE